MLRLRIFIYALISVQITVRYLYFTQISIVNSLYTLLHYFEISFDLLLKPAEPWSGIDLEHSREHFGEFQRSTN